MDDFLSPKALPRRVMNMFFLVDVSGSMRGAKIGAVNDAIRNVLPIVEDISSGNADSEIKISALLFSNGCKWLYNDPKSPCDFDWDDQVASGGTDLGEAYNELEKKLHHVKNGGWMGSGSGSFAPVFILLSDGEPTDNPDGGLKKLKANGWFKSGIKIAIAIGNDADRDELEKFAGVERTIEVHDIESLKKVIRCVVVTSSMVGSKSTSASVNTTATIGGEEVQIEATKEAELTAQITKEVNDIDNASIGVTSVDKFMDGWA